MILTPILSEGRANGREFVYRTRAIKGWRNYSKFVSDYHIKITKKYFQLETLGGGHYSRAAFNGADTVI